MKKIIKDSSIVTIVLAMTILAGCVTSSDMQTLQIERRQDLNRIKQLEAELEESKQLLKEEIEKSQSPVRQRTADMWAELQSLRKDLATVRGDLDTLNLRLDRQVGASNSTRSLSGLEERIDEIDFILENQLQVDMGKARGERAAALAAPVAAENTAASPTPATETKSEETATPAVETDPAKALYDKAYALYKQGQYEKARSYWAEFTDTFKNHSFSASAVFWQGQCYFKLKDYARSAILFEDVIEKYKKSSKYKSALLKAGYCWNYLGKPELAKMRMNEIVEKFPKSVEATQAKRFLEKAK
ncbi:tetratricopeptide repeat protein [Pseudodesulfovibrio cashew]|uniref:Tetratricopeptide repeat protein n=1 Tax=Pseudodesulfovibrio cashew TaxID=2678688 RepID=A0A6I6JJT2_9BACT|nr:tetratricopeptide repeat protein [Pseudodesulfovibrio cashew]QGY41228.1 tetratricopeptide repeat protein [Pseudodesulfovibrio cashew]